VWRCPVVRRTTNGAFTEFRYHFDSLLYVIHLFSTMRSSLVLHYRNGNQRTWRARVGGMENGCAWPCLAVSGRIWPCLAMSGRVWPCWACLAVSGRVWPCLAVSGRVWPCLAVLDVSGCVGRVCPCRTMSGCVAVPGRAWPHPGRGVRGRLVPDWGCLIVCVGAGPHRGRDVLGRLARGGPD
jgi:hypothetical protein